MRAAICGRGRQLLTATLLHSKKGLSRYDSRKSCTVCDVRSMAAGLVVKGDLCVQPAMYECFL
jgi:hypothetical protein